jgi:DNA-binding PadR family transcriptional regulator
MRRSTQTTTLLAEFLREGGEQWRYGYDLSRATGLASGTLYPILIRLADRGMLETSWESTTEAAGTGRPPRHMYRLTQEGQRYARQQVRAAAEQTAGLAVPAPALGGATR